MRILIVEENQIIAKFLSTKILSLISVDIDIAKSFDEVKEYITKNNYILTILDLQIEKEYEYEINYYILDFLIAKNIPTIALSSHLEEKNEIELHKRNIIDFILKNRSESIDYLSHLAKRLIKNKDHKVLVVDDSVIYRKEITKILEQQQLSVITTKNVQEGVALLRQNSDISLVVTDYEMPGENGLEFVLSIRKKYNKYQLPVIGISSEKENSILFLKHGVNDFVRKPFFKEELSTRVNNTLDSIENIKQLNDFVNTDFLTGAKNRKYFYQEGQKIYTKCKISKEHFVIATLDIDFFKKINDKYGHDVGDIVIKQLATILNDNVKGQDIVARVGGEEFCVLLRDIEAKHAFNFFNNLREKISNTAIKIDDSSTISFSVSMGIATKTEDSFEEMIKQSDLALYSSKNNGRNMVSMDIDTKQEALL